MSEPIPDERWYVRPAGIPLRISSGGVVVRRAEDELLIALTREVKLPGYVLPKGGVEAGESLIEAAHREIAEEAGLTELTLLGKLGLGGHLNLERTRWVKAHFFLFSTDQIEGYPLDDEHHFGMSWFPLGELPDLCWRDQHALLEETRPQIRALIEESD